MKDKNPERPLNLVEGLRPDPDEMVKRLIRMADPGPEIPPHGADQVKTAIRPQWRREVRSRARRRALLWSGGGLAAAAALFLAMNLSWTDNAEVLAPSEPLARIASVLGSLEVLPPDGSLRHLTVDEVGEIVELGSWLRTSRDSGAALSVGSQYSLRLDADTRVRWVEPRVIALDRGAVYIDTQEDRKDPIEVRTALGVARDIGTQFEVRQGDGHLTLRVREGLVSFTRRGDEFQLTHGASFRIKSEGEPEPGKVEPFDPAWDWVQMLAPPFDIEGRTVVSFLDWVSRETGLWVHYVSPEVESFAGTTTLHGSIVGLSPEQAYEVSLLTSGLRATRKKGTLEVGWAKER